jgi:hypothetical protein
MTKSQIMCGVFAAFSFIWTGLLLKTQDDTPYFLFPFVLGCIGAWGMLG